MSSSLGARPRRCSDYLHKGNQALVEGRMRQHTWETADGQKRSKHEIVAERVQFLGTRASGAQAPQTSDEGDEEAPDDEDIPFMHADRDEGDTPGATRRSAEAHGDTPPCPTQWRITHTDLGGSAAAPSRGLGGGPRGTGQCIS